MGIVHGLEGSVNKIIILFILFLKSNFYFIKIKNSNLFISLDGLIHNFIANHSRNHKNMVNSKNIQ